MRFMTRTIAFGKPLIGEEEERAVLEVLRSGWLAHGPKAKEFEAAFAAEVGTKHAVSVSSCTAALHLSLLALGVGPGDEVIVPALTHVATAHAALYVGAKPVFADIDPATYCISPADIARRLTPRTRAIHVVHFAGLACDMDTILPLAGERGIPVIEDCAHAVGTRYRGRAAGSFGRTGCFSFYPVKHITTGEGGMLVTDDDRVASAAYKQRAFGIDVPAYYRQKPGVYDTPLLGFNYRMTDIAAAMGLCQLRRAGDGLRRRTENAAVLTERLAGLSGLVLPVVPSGSVHGYLFYQLRVTAEFPMTRDDLIARLRSEGIGASIYYATPVHRMTLYRELFGTDVSRLPESDRAAAETIALPVNPPLGPADMETIARAVRGAAERA
jgi:dTDP-4-amino-4,6-dideoxygalactose transaminase